MCVRASGLLQGSWLRDLGADSRGAWHLVTSLAKCPLTCEWPGRRVLVCRGGETEVVTQAFGGSPRGHAEEEGRTGSEPAAQQLKPACQSPQAGWSGVCLAVSPVCKLDLPWWQIALRSSRPFHEQMPVLGSNCEDALGRKISKRGLKAPKRRRSKRTRDSEVVCLTRA